MLIDVQEFLDVAAGDDSLSVRVQRSLATLADELNCCLPGYEVRLVHLDTGDFLEFLNRPVSSDDEPPF
jgi:hypothetical protein